MLLPELLKVTADSAGGLGPAVFVEAEEFLFSLGMVMETFEEEDPVERFSPAAAT